MRLIFFTSLRISNYKTCLKSELFLDYLIFFLLNLLVYDRFDELLSYLDLEYYFNKLIMNRVSNLIVLKTIFVKREGFLIRKFTNTSEVLKNLFNLI